MKATEGFLCKTKNFTKLQGQFITVHFFSSKFQEMNLSSFFQKHYAVFTIAFAFFIEYMLGYDENEASAILRLDRREKEMHLRPNKTFESEPKPSQKN